MTLDDGQAHHLIRVLRLEDGAALEAVDREGGVWRAALVDSDPISVEILERGPASDANPRTVLEVWVPLLKGGRTDDVVRQLTELGAARIIPYASERSVARVEPSKAAGRRERWRSIAAEATRQCGRSDLPQIPEEAPLSGLPRPVDRPGVFFWEEGGPPAAETLEQAVARSPGVLSILTGPEGGLSPEEARTLELRGWRPASLGSRILRADTAPLVAATLAFAALGEAGYGSGPG